MATRLIAMACWHVNISFNRFDRVWVGLCLEDSRLVDSERIFGKFSNCKSNDAEIL